MARRKVYTKKRTQVKISSNPQTIEEKVQYMMYHCPAWPYTMMSKPEMEGTSFKWRDSATFYNEYLSMDKNDKRRIALEELAQKGLTASSSRATVNKAVSEVISSVTNGETLPPATRENTKRTLNNQRTGADMKVQQKVALTTNPEPSSKSNSKEAKNERLDACMELMTYATLQYESFSATPYKDPTKTDPNDLAIAFGNHSHPDGTDVKLSDKITSVEQAIPYYKSHFDRNIREAMVSKLDVEKMTDGEIVAISNLCYNAGAGVLSKKFGGKTMAQLANAYFSNRDNAAAKAAFENAYKSIIRSPDSKGVLRRNDVLIKRRASEWKILTGEVQITIEDGVKSEGNVINLKYNASVLQGLGRTDKMSDREIEAYIKQNCQDNCSDSLLTKVQADVERAARIKSRGGR